MPEDRSRNIIREFGEELLAEIKAATPRASGATADAINIEFTPLGFIIRGPEYINNLINGRGASKKGSKPGELFPKILEWIKSLSIRPRESGMSTEVLAFLITRSIHRKGFKGKGDFYKDVLNQAKINSVADKLLEERSKSILQQIKETFEF